MVIVMSLKVHISERAWCEQASLSKGVFVYQVKAHIFK